VITNKHTCWQYNQREKRLILPRHWFDYNWTNPITIDTIQLFNIFESLLKRFIQVLEARTCPKLQYSFVWCFSMFSIFIFQARFFRVRRLIHLLWKTRKWAHPSVKINRVETIDSAVRLLKSYLLFILTTFCGIFFLFFKSLRDCIIFMWWDEGLLNRKYRKSLASSLLETIYDCDHDRPSQNSN